MFTKRHYNKITKLLNKRLSLEHQCCICDMFDDLFDDFCNMFEEDNLSFDRIKFEKAVYRKEKLEG